MRVYSTITTLACLSFLYFTQTLEAQVSCSALVKGDIAFDVLKCGRINPEQTFKSKVGRFAFIKDLPKEKQQEFYDSYRGLIVTGKVAYSLAIRSGLTTEKGALATEKISVYIDPGKTSCENILGKRLKGELVEACCMGGADVPCLLNSAYMLKAPSEIGAAGSSAGHKLMMDLEKNEQFRKWAKEFVKEGRVSDIETLQKWYEESRLDERGRFMLAHSYRREDKCNRAITILEPLYRELLGQKYWIQVETFLRRSALLLARCYSMEQNEGGALSVLDAFLQEPSKYRSEIEASLEHPDFGWIRTTKAYSRYRARAEKALAQTAAASEGIDPLLGGDG